MTKRNDTIAAAQDPKGESRLMRALNKAIGWDKQGWQTSTFAKLPIFYELDFVVLRDSRYIEAWLTGKEFAEDSGKPFYIIQSYPKGNERVYIYLEVTADLKPDIVWAGRTDRGDWQDLAPHVELPDAWFTVIDL